MTTYWETICFIHFFFLFTVYPTTLPIALTSNDETIREELTKRMWKEIIISQYEVLHRYVPGTIHENYRGMRVQVVQALTLRPRGDVRPVCPSASFKNPKN